MLTLYLGIMKKFGFVLVALALLAGCAGSAKQDKAAEEQARQMEAIELSIEELDESIEAVSEELEETQNEIDSLLNGI